MGRSPCCSKEINKGAWSREEDETLSKYVAIHGEGKWQKVAQNAGLKRCGKSCRQRWLNYLKPGIKRGDISADEEDMIIRLHRLLGNRWALIAKRLPGRTDNEIKNYWNTNLSKRLQKLPASSSSSASHKHKHIYRFDQEEEKAKHVVAPEAPRPRRLKAVQYISHRILENNSRRISDEASLTDFLVDIDQNHDQWLIADDDSSPSKLPQIEGQISKVGLKTTDGPSPSSPSDQCQDRLETLLDVELKRMASFLGLEK